MIDVTRLAGVYPLADDDPRFRHDAAAMVEASISGGATVVQLRLKHTPDSAALELARWAAQRAHAAGALLIVNDRFDLADLSGADGVHLGQDDLAPEDLPEDVRRRLLVGLSTHTLEQMDSTRGRPVDYVAFGPVFATGSKTSEYSARGTEALADAVERAGDRPVVAIGGLNASRLPEVRSAGASAAAVISAVADAEDPAAEVRRLQQIFRKGT